jgi:hypothetical protein
MVYFTIERPFMRYKMVNSSRMLKLEGSQYTLVQRVKNNPHLGTPVSSALTAVFAKEISLADFRDLIGEDRYNMVRELGNELDILM